MARVFWRDFSKIRAMVLPSCRIITRVKIIGYGNQPEDGMPSFIESEFFLLPNFLNDFEEFLANLTIMQADDKASNGCNGLNAFHELLMHTYKKRS